MSDASRKKRIRWILGLSLLFVCYIVSNMDTSRHRRRDIATQALAVAVTMQNVSGVRSALHQGANPNIENINDFLPYVNHPQRSAPLPTTLLLYAVSNNLLPATDADTTIARLLLEAGENPNIAATDGYTPLMSAAARGDANHVRLLLANRAEVNARDADGKTALSWIQMPVSAGDSQKATMQRNKDSAAELLKQAGAKE